MENQAPNPLPRPYPPKLTNIVLFHTLKTAIDNCDIETIKQIAALKLDLGTRRFIRKADGKTFYDSFLNRAKKQLPYGNILYYTLRNGIDENGSKIKEESAEIYSKRLEIAKLLIEIGVDDHYYYMLKHIMNNIPHKGATDIIKALAKRGVDIVKASLDRLIIFRAIQAGDYEMTKCLLESGVNPNTRNNYGSTALNFACCISNSEHSNIFEIIKILLKHGADIEARTPPEYISGQTPLTASASISLQHVRLLIEHGANVNAQSTLGRWTALHAAVSRNKLDMIKFLIDSGADLGIANAEGKTAAEYAKSPEAKALLTPKPALTSSQIVNQDVGQSLE